MRASRRPETGSPLPAYRGAPRPRKHRVRRAPPERGGRVAGERTHGVTSDEPCIRVVAADRRDVELTTALDVYIHARTDRR